VCRQEIFECLRHFIVLDGHNVLESFLSGGERLVGGKLHHFSEAVELTDRFLDLVELATGFIELFLGEEAVTRSTFVENVKLRHFRVFNNH
jgi:hypothetical protein